MNVFDLSAKLTLDSSAYDRGLDNAVSGLSRLGTSLKKGLSAAAKIGTAAVTAASAAVGAIVKQSVDSFGAYEQLVGGIDTLFKRSEQSLEDYVKTSGKSVAEAVTEWEEMNRSADTVMRNAANAFKTAGVSANEYMETAIQSSAALISSLGGDTQKAAELIDMSIVDMADNVNKMGTTMEAVQNAYRGFSRGNFTMLDNLALGFAGTKQGMQELLDKAAEISGFEYDISSYGDIVQAIHVVQEEMGIAGTTAREAQETIQGSLSALGAAWQNLVAGFGNKDADLGALIDDVVSSAEVALGNLTPVIERAIKGISKTIRSAAPSIGKMLPGMVSSILPDLISAGAELLAGIGAGLLESAPALVETAKTLVNTVLDSIGIGDAVRELFGNLSGPISEAVETIRTSLSDAWDRIKEAISPVTEAFGEWVSSGQAMKDVSTFAAEAIGLLADAISSVAGFVATAVEKGREFVDWLNSGSQGAEIFKTLLVSTVAAIAAYKAYNAVLLATKVAQGLVTTAQTLLNGVMAANPIGIIVAAIGALVAAFIYLWNTSDEFREFWIGAWEAIKSAAITAFEAVKNFLIEAWDKIKEAFSSVGEWFHEKFSDAKEAIMNAWSNIKQKFTEKWTQIKDAFSTTKTWFSNKFTEAKNATVSAWDDIKTKMSDVWERIKEAFRTGEAWDWAVDMATKFINGVNSFFDRLWNLGSEAIHKVWEGITSLDPAQWGRDLIDKFTSGITNAWQSGKSAIINVANTVADWIGFSEPKKGPLSDFHTFAPDMMNLFAEGIRDNERMLQDTVAEAFNFKPTIRAGYDSNGYPVNGNRGDGYPSTIVVQSVLDGKIIGETAYDYARNRKRMVGA